MTEEEKKAIEYYKDYAEILNNELILYGHIKTLKVDYKKLKTLVNLIQKKDTEINKLNNVIDKIKDITRWLIIIPSRDKEGDYRPIKNTTAQECYKALAEIKEIMKEDK